MPTYDSAVVTREHVEKLLTDHPEMCGMLLSGGGVTGATLMKAKTAGPDAGGYRVTIGFDLHSPETI